VAALVGRQATSVRLSYQNAAPGAKSAIYACLVGRVKRSVLFYAKILSENHGSVWC